MFRCSTLFLLLGLWCANAHVEAQFWDFVYRVLNGDTAAGPDHDTTYIASYRDDLVLSPVISSQGNSIDIDRKDGGTLSYETNTPAQYGLALDYKWLGVEASFSIPGLSDLDPALGTTKSSGLGFGYTGRRWWFRNFFLSSKGFHAADPTLVDPDWQEGDPYPYRGDLENFTYRAGLNRGFNVRRFSYNAAVWQMERQKRSAGSWTLGSTFWYSRTRSSGSLIPEFDRASYSSAVDVVAVRRWVVSLTGGYAHTFVFWHGGFINLMLVPGIGCQQQQLETADDGSRDSGWGVAGTTEFRFGMGYVADRWYSSLTVNVYESTGAIAPDVDLATSFVNIRFAAGWRFEHIKPIWPRVGL